MDIKKEIKGFPDAPGVYLMKDERGAIIYVGKASSLKERVASYFRQRSASARLRALIEKIRDIEYITTGSEAEALLLESALVKAHQPKYNVALRDDKSYPFLKLTVNERFPRLVICRGKKNDGARYFGPFIEARLLRHALDFLRRVFPLRTCRCMPKTVCLNYYLRQCLAPCVDKVGEAGCRRIADQLVMFLEGKRPQLLKQLQEQMLAASRGRHYEEAARLRDQVWALSQTVAVKSRYGRPEQLEALQEILGLKKNAERIEAFDVSNISGKEAVGSMVTFVKAKPYKDGYRKFKIKEISGIDDYGMMREIVRRRYEHLVEEKGKLPDLIVIDGGKGHLSSAREALGSLGLEGVPIMAIAKEFEHIYLPGREEPIKLPYHCAALHLIQRIRDEAHRFAIEYHTTLRRRLATVSELDGIKGIGPKKKAALLRHFGSIPAVKKARAEALTEVRGIHERLAQEIKKAFT